MKFCRIAFTISFAVLLTTPARSGDWGPPSKNLVPLAAPLSDPEVFSYSYLDFEYGYLDFGNPYLGNGSFYSAGFSMALGSTFFLTGSFADGDYDYHTGCLCSMLDVETRRYRLGLGARKSLTKSIDLTLEGGAEHLEASYGGKGFLDYDSWGYYVGPGIRARAGRFEGFAKAIYFGREGDMSQEYLSHHSTKHLDRDEYGWLFVPGALYHLTDHLALKVSAEIGEIDTAYLFGVRYEF